MVLPTIEQSLKSVEQMKSELEQAAIHLERALFMKNKLKREYMNTETFINQLVEHHDPPGKFIERK